MWIVLLFISNLSVQFVVSHSIFFSMSNLDFSAPFHDWRLISFAKIHHTNVHLEYMKCLFRLPVSHGKKNMYLWLYIKVSCLHLHLILEALEVDQIKNVDGASRERKGSNKLTKKRQQSRPSSTAGRPDSQQGRPDSAASGGSRYSACSAEDQDSGIDFIQRPSTPRMCARF